MMPQELTYTITGKSADYLEKIVATVKRLESETGFKSDMKLHRENRARAIHASLALEGNSLAFGEVRAVIDGNAATGKQAEIREVKNACEAYDQIMTFNPWSTEDLLRAHMLFTQSLILEPGKFRSGDIALYDGDGMITIGAHPQSVPQLLEDSFGWAKTSELHPVLKSAIAHYEIEAIHPFEIGNGCVGRLWQTLLLAKWNEIFAWIPLEAALHQNRRQYHRAIEESKKAGSPDMFIEFMFSTLYEVLAELLTNQLCVNL